LDSKSYEYVTKYTTATGQFMHATLLLLRCKVQVYNDVLFRSLLMAWAFHSWRRVQRMQQM